MFVAMKNRIAAVTAFLVIGVAAPLVATAGENKSVRASELLNAQVTNGFDPIGSVSDLMLNEQTNEIQYILYQVHDPFNVFAEDAGFVAMNKVELEKGFGPRELEVRFKNEESQQAPRELTVTRREADHRLLTNLVGAPLYFGEDGTREIKDILVDRKTGKLQSYVIEMNPDTFFNDQIRVIPAGDVTITEKGVAKTSVKLDNVVGEEEYRLGSL